ncbi:MAG: class I SAM-dependent methyltransferase [Candidatus Aureabacteria bacterium]|nr:class I SAM-dependent methyltransferase [Candidatus Auribacterota bacterium]
MDENDRKWIEKDGVIFFKKIGLQEGHFVLDFGCGEGYYAIPAAEVVGEKGRVYALDKDMKKLLRLKELMRTKSINNVEILSENSVIPLKDASLDVVFCYDVIHYLNKRKRSAVYDEIHRVLKNEGFFSVYPKHYKQDNPLDELADMELEDVIKEIEESSFQLKRKFQENILHSHNYNKGEIVHFTLLSKSRESL